MLLLRYIDVVNIEMTSSGSFLLGTRSRTFDGLGGPG
jgi:hypothetical protein